MYTPPTEFVRRLDSTFRGRLRIRWSLHKEEWHIEQKITDGIALAARNSHDDRYIRARDGYHFVMAVKPQAFAYCRICHLRNDVPALTTGEIKCDYCERVKARRGREFGGYWPLNGDRLIDHLKMIDPENDGLRASITTMDRQREQTEITRQRDIRNHIESATYDDKYQLFDTPFSGYTGTTFGTPDINGKRL